MIYETIIGLCMLVYVLWKFLLSPKWSTNVECSEVHNVVIKETPSPDKSLETLEGTKKKKSTEKDFQTKIDTLKNNQKNTLIDNVIKQDISTDLKTPSLLLTENRKNYNSTFSEKVIKRESPPKERFAEFQKSILSDDKIQSIIQNLSLDIHDVSPEKHLESEIKPLIIENTNISEKAVQLQKSIDEIADKIKLLNDTVITKDIDRIESLKLSKSDNLNTPTREDIENIPVVENKLLLKRLQKQSGLPTGLNFGSVIGELKIKTKNASNGLKPVFKKFDVDYDATDSQVNNLI